MIHLVLISRGWLTTVGNQTRLLIVEFAVVSDVLEALKYIQQYEELGADLDVAEYPLLNLQYLEEEAEEDD